MRTLDWYFDFISPYSYLQFELLPTLPADLEVRMKPLLFAGLLKHWDNVGPAEIMPKRTWTYRNVAWLAHRHGVPLTMPAEHPFNPLPLLRLCIAKGSTPEVIGRLFHYVWRDGMLPGEAQNWQALLDELGVTPAQLESAEVKAQLHANGADAIRANVFGVPSSVLDGQVFWGVEATDMLLAYLRGDPFFGSDSFTSAHRVPNGLQRSPGGK